VKWAGLFLLINAAPAVAQHGEHHERPSGMQHDTMMHRHPVMTDVLGIPMARQGSGTSWVPDSTPMYMQHARFGRWDVMLHGNVFLQYINEGSDRGDSQFGSINWLMGMAMRRVGDGRLMLRAMLSAERWTVGECGYPDLLATGETCDGRRLHDRQHPHDLFMELAGWYHRALNDDVAIELYGGPAAEPALGPTAYPHRVSAFPIPLAPITHHWLDATHITFGNITAGVFGRQWKVEGSLFNGREPDEDRADINLASLSSYSARVSFLPSPLWSLQVSAGQLNDAEVSDEPGHDRVDVTRYTASAMYNRPVGRRAFLATTLAFGHDVEHGIGTSAVLAEASLNLKDRHVMAGRFEWVEKTGENLGLDDEAVEDDIFRLAKAGVAYTYQVASILGWTPGLGVGGSISFIPEDLEPVYGEQQAFGFIAFVSLRPERMRMHMPAMPMPSGGEHMRHNRPR